MELNSRLSNHVKNQLESILDEFEGKVTNVKQNKDYSYKKMLENYSSGDEHGIVSIKSCDFVEGDKILTKKNIANTEIRCTTV